MFSSSEIRVPPSAVPLCPIQAPSSANAIPDKIASVMAQAQKIVKEYKQNMNQCVSIAKEGVDRIHDLEAAWAYHRVSLDFQRGTRFQSSPVPTTTTSPMAYKKSTCMNKTTQTSDLAPTPSPCVSYKSYNPDQTSQLFKSAEPHLSTAPKRAGSFGSQFGDPLKIFLEANKEISKIEAEVWRAVGQLKDSITSLDEDWVIAPSNMILYSETTLQLQDINYQTTRNDIFEIFIWLEGLQATLTRTKMKIIFESSFKGEWTETESDKVLSTLRLLFEQIHSSGIDLRSIRTNLLSLLSKDLTENIVVQNLFDY